MTILYYFELEFRAKERIALKRVQSRKAPSESDPFYMKAESKEYSNFLNSFLNFFDERKRKISQFRYGNRIRIHPARYFESGWRIAL